MANYTQTSKLWSEWYQKGTYARSTNTEKHIETSKHLVETYGPQMNGCKTFCELGAGSGRNIWYFHEKHPNWTYRGNDINPDIHNQIAAIYPNLLDWADIAIADTLTFLQRGDFSTDITFTHGHLMHLPNDVIDEICALIAQKTRKCILLHEAYLNGRGIGLRKRLKYRKYRFDRDYEDRFQGFELKDKCVSNHPTKKGIRYCVYLFEKVTADSNGE